MVFLSFKICLDYFYTTDADFVEMLPHEKDILRLANSCSHNSNCEGASALNSDDQDKISKKYFFCPLPSSSCRDLG